MQAGISGRGARASVFQTKFQPRWEFQEECSTILENENASRERGKIVDKNKFFENQENLIRDGILIFGSILVM